MLFNCFAVGAGGCIGSVFRYLISLIPILGRNTFPVATLLVNGIGAVMIGMITGCCEFRGDCNPQTVLFLKTGVCGGFTTFSAFALESAELFRGDRPVLALTYAIVSVAICICGIFAGRWLAGMIK